MVYLKKYYELSVNNATPSAKQAKKEIESATGSGAAERYYYCFVLIIIQKVNIVFVNNIGETPALGIPVGIALQFAVPVYTSAVPRMHFVYHFHNHNQPILS